MKLVAVLTTPPGAGGGHHQALNAIVQLQRLCSGRHEFEVLCTDRESLVALRELGVQARWRRTTLVDRALALMAGNVVWSTLQRRLRIKGPFERALERMGCDLAYFCAPNWLPLALQELNYLTTLWDVCHLEHPEFPEVRRHHTIALRERVFVSVLQAAVLVVVDSVRLAELAAFHYRLAPGRLLAMPFAPAPQLNADDDPAGASRAHDHGDGQDGPFFYPANLWAHKNHIRILQALVLLGQRGWRPRAVFCGHDQGTLAHLQRFAADHGVAAQVDFVGFVDSARLSALYRSALAVVMPTYFGQTNLPPLEAWTLGVPLIYSASLAAHAGDAALLADPDDAGALAGAMWACRNPAVRASLREAGYRRLAEIAGERALAEQALAAHLDAFAARRACWAGGVDGRAPG